MFKLKAFRKERRLSQTALSEIIGYNQAYISAIESGTKPVSDNFLEKIEEKFGVDLSEHKSWTQSASVQQPTETPETIHWREKYFELLERYNRALEEKEALRAAYETKSKLVVKPSPKH